MRPLLVFKLIVMLAAAGGRLLKPAPVTHDRTFGAGAVFIGQTPKFRHSFKVANDTGAALKITDLKRSCTCTAAAVKKNLLAPGDTTDLDLEINANPGLNQWLVVCSLITDPPTSPELVYEVLNRSYPHLRFDVSTLDLGVRKTGKLSRGGGMGNRGSAKSGVTFELYESADEESDRPISVSVPKPLFADHDPKPEVELIEGGKVRRSRYQVHISLADDLDSMASGTHTVTAKTARGEMTSLVAVWVVESPLIVSPTRLSFGLVGPDDAVPSRKVVIKSTDGRAFRLSKATSRSAEVEVRALATEPAPSHIVELALLKRSGSKRFLAGEVTIATDHPEAASIPISWSAILKSKQ